jgi:hypothetical protein
MRLLCRNDRNFHAILLQIIDMIGLSPWKDGEVDNFLDFAQVGAMIDLISHLALARLRTRVTGWQR